MAYTISDVRKQLSLLGFQDVPDHIVQSFIEKLKQQDQQSSRPSARRPALSPVIEDPAGESMASPMPVKQRSYFSAVFRAASVSSDMSDSEKSESSDASENDQVEDSEDEDEDEDEAQSEGTLSDHDYREDFRSTQPQSNCPIAEKLQYPPLQSDSEVDNDDSDSDHESDDTSVVYQAKKRSSASGLEVHADGPKMPTDFIPTQISREAHSKSTIVPPTDLRPSRQSPSTLPPSIHLATSIPQPLAPRTPPSTSVSPFFHSESTLQSQSFSKPAALSTEAPATNWPSFNPLPHTTAAVASYFEPVARASSSLIFDPDHGLNRVRRSDIAATATVTATAAAPSPFLERDASHLAPVSFFGTDASRTTPRTRLLAQPQSQSPHAPPAVRSLLSAELHAVTSPPTPHSSSHSRGDHTHHTHESREATPTRAPLTRLRGSPPVRIPLAHSLAASLAASSSAHADDDDTDLAPFFFAPASTATAAAAASATATAAVSSPLPLPSSSPPHPRSLAHVQRPVSAHAVSHESRSVAQPTRAPLQPRPQSAPARRVVKPSLPENAQMATRAQMASGDEGLLERPATGYLASVSSFDRLQGKLSARQRADPVSRMQQYKSAWRNDDFLSKTSSKTASVLEIRERMRQRPEALKKSRPYTPIEYEACPKRHELRWKIRAKMLKENVPLD